MGIVSYHVINLIQIISMNKLSIFLFLFLYATQLFSQVNGTVTNENSEGLSYVNVFVKNTSTGTTTNLDGYYSLKLEPGNYTIVYQFIGYKSQERSVRIGTEAYTENVQLQTASYEMPQVTIEANAEDPAYAIIRKAQSRRKFHLRQNENYECDAYMRGFNKIFDAPEKIMGIDVGDLDETLDSTRQGVIYLSESVSHLYVAKGRSKEVMFSSKVSGNNQGYSFNSAQEMDFNFYNNSLELNRHIISPIGSNAMSIYNYKLEGATIDENGQLVNKIKVTPKNSFDPAFSGFIYINEDLWNINSLELSVTKEASQIPFIDTLKFKISYIPLEQNRWLPISNVINFRMSAFGFELGGNFACVYSNYKLDDVDESVFNREVYVVESEANTRTEIYWDSIRPIPLTIEEKIDYKQKDSIQLVRESTEYLDSIDRENNTFKFGDVLSGYSHQNSQTRSNWSISTPLTNLAANTISGWNGSFGFSYRKAYNEDRTRRLRIGATVNYALSDRQWRPTASASYLANRTNNMSFEIEAGRALQQFNSMKPITNRLNTIMTLFFRRNYLKAYDSKFFRAQLSTDIGAILRLRSSVTYEDRSVLENTYDGSIFYKDSRVFSPNISGFEDHKSLILRLSLRIRPGEQLVRYPNRIFRTGSEWPTFWIHYKQALNNITGDAGISLIHVSIDKDLELRNLGDLQMYLHAGSFLQEPDYFIDQMHFMGNQTHLGYSDNYNRNFLLMPYYGLSTASDFVEMHIQHNFKGFILGKIPIIRHLGWHLAGGYKFLGRSGPNYREWHLGIDNIGYRFFRVFRIDLVWADQLDIPQTETDSYSRFGVVVGLDFRI